MSTNNKRPRGRPRQFDEDEVLDAAMRVFWQKGLSATSIDDLTLAMGMNKPSVYRAFGDKEAIFRLTLDRFCKAMEQALRSTLFAEPKLERGLTAFYTTALGVYSSGEESLGCLMMSNATCSAPTHPEVKADLLRVLQSIDDAFEKRFKKAHSEGQVPKRFDCESRARLAQAILHSLSVRARAGEDQKQLQNMIKESVSFLMH